MYSTDVYILFMDLWRNVYSVTSLEVMRGWPCTALWALRIKQATTSERPMVLDCPATTGVF